MATIYDVARAAGVTAATVSVALSGRGVVNRKTRERILQCAQDLGYRPNLVARSLTLRRTSTIGLVVYDLSNPFYAEVVLAVEQIAQRAGYRVIFANTTGDAALAAELLEELAGRQVDGIIAMPGGLRAESMRALAATGLPIVPCLWDEEQNHGLSPAVGVDFGTGGRLAADHLLDLGHRRIAVIAIGTADEGFIRAREAAFVERLQQRECPVDPALWQWACNATIERGYAAAQTLLALPEPPTAIYSTNDVMALGILSAARERGLQVPDDLSVIGFDDVNLARYYTPPLTTVRIEKEALMPAATDVLLRLIAGEEVAPPPPLVPTLVIRDSTAPPGTRGCMGREE